MSCYWRGALVDDRLAAQLDEVAVLVPAGTILRPTQGSWSGGVAASGGTHSGGGAVDLAGQDPGMDDVMRAAIRDAMRQVGIAAWVRDPTQANPPWPYHVHGISVQPGGKADPGCLSGDAHGQVVDYYEGRNGLASNAPDDGPRTWVGVTWETYQQQEDDDMTPEQAKKFDELYWMVQQIKPQTDRLPRIQTTTDQTNWGVNDATNGLRVMVAKVQSTVNAILTGVNQLLVDDDQVKAAPVPPQPAPPAGDG